MSCRLFRRSVCGVFLGALAAALLCVSAARADYIAQIREGASGSGYLYITEGAIKKESLIIRDDKKVLYFIGWAQQEPGAALPSADVAGELSAIKEQMQASEGIPVELLQTTGPLVMEYETWVVPYSLVEERRRAFGARLKGDRDETFRRASSARSPLERSGMLQSVAVVDAYLENRPTWSNTGETAVIAGRQCTKYHVALPPIFEMDVWMTTELGPGYTAGKMFANSYFCEQGGVPAMEVFAEIPGFPMKMDGRYRNIEGRHIFKLYYEILNLMETDLDEKEFAPLPGAIRHGFPQSPGGPGPR